MSYPQSTTPFDPIFEERLTQIEPGLIRRVNFRMDRAGDLDRDDAVQEVRILLWKRFSAERKNGRRYPWIIGRRLRTPA
jgi:hypothetical protein